MNIVSLIREPQAPGPSADKAGSDLPPSKKQRATGEQIRRLVRAESNCSDPITVAERLVENHPELAISSFRWLVRQVAWALALEQLREFGVTPQG